MKIRPGPLTMISLMSGSKMRCWIGRRNGRISSNPFIRVVRLQAGESRTCSRH